MTLGLEKQIIFIILAENLGEISTEGSVEKIVWYKACKAIDIYVRIYIFNYPIDQ